MLWPQEHRLCVSLFYEPTEMKEDHALRDAGGLLHVMRNDHYRHLMTKLVDKLFEFCGRERVERGCGLVHQQNFRRSRKGARETKALLLSARKVRSRFAEPVFHFFPKPRDFQITLDKIACLLVPPNKIVQTRTISDICEDGGGKGIWFLSDPADMAPKNGRADIWRIDVRSERSQAQIVCC